MIPPFILTIATMALGRAEAVAMSPTDIRPGDIVTLSEPDTATRTIKVRGAIKGGVRWLGCIRPPEGIAISHIPEANSDVTFIEKTDVAIAKRVAPASDHIVTRVLGVLSEVADQPQMVLLNSMTLSAGLIAGKPRLARAGARMLASHLLATAIKHTIKRRVDRTRPYVTVTKGDYVMEAGDGEESKVTSFPSGHTAGAVAVAQAFGREFPEYALAAGLAATAVALVQIPRGTHYPSDLVAGAAIGHLAELPIGAFGEPVLQYIGDLAERRARLSSDPSTESPPRDAIPLPG